MSLMRLSGLKGERNVTPLEFEIVLYKRYSRTKPLNPAIAFWVVATLQEVKRVKHVRAR